MNKVPRIVITTGEPAGIGPDICLSLEGQFPDHELVLIADPKLLQQRAQQLGLQWPGPAYQPDRIAIAGNVVVLPITLRNTVTAGQLNPDNAPYVLDMLNRAIDGCLQQEFAALVTAPLHKGVINDAGIPFTGHTEHLSERSAAAQVVMMLASENLRVALATTHLPLRDVADAITQDGLTRVLRCLHSALISDFGCLKPHILIAGLNPHAGESGHLGSEESETIEPVIERLRAEGMNLTGPLPADTLFTPKYLETADAVLAMYHDQGLPVLKYQSFGNAVNITLGLPFIRTSVDHGTALDLAGSGKASNSSLLAAIVQAGNMLNLQQV